MVGLKLWEIGQFKDIAANHESFEKLQKNQYIRYEDLPLVTKDGKKIQVEFVSNVYLVDGQHIIQCNIRDISARAKVQEMSQTHLTALLVENKTKDEFLAALSHELRTPLSAISSMLDVLELQQSLANMSDAQTPTELDRSGLKLIRRNVHILVSLINELLDLTHISRGDLHLELATIDAHHAIGDALRDVAAQLKAKRIDLRVNLRAEFRHIKADNSKFHRIITNLIGNAIKFTPVDGKIRVVTTNAPPNDDLIIEISDSGIGIDSESLARIFSPFEQGDTSVRRRFGGLGLGLSISKSLAEAHGATLEAESGGKDNGSTFRLRFKTEQIFPGELVLMSQPILVTSMRVLLVEDHADTRECLHRLLESGGHMVRSAEDARSAIAWSEREKFDLLVADVSLPDRSGLELLLELRERDPRLLAIALSGYGMPQDFVDSKEAGFVEHFVKPVDMPKLHAAINRLATRKAFEKKKKVYLKRGYFFTPLL